MKFTAMNEACPKNAQSIVFYALWLIPLIDQKTKRLSKFFHL